VILIIIDEKKKNAETFPSH